MADTANFGWTLPTVSASTDTWGTENNQVIIDEDADLKLVKDTADAALARAGGTMTGLLTLSAGASITPATTPAATSVGYLGAPASTQVSAYTLAMTDCGKMQILNKATADAVTIPPNSSVAFPIGTVIPLLNIGAGAWTITRGSGVVLRLAGVVTDANRTIAQYGLGSLIKVATDTWYVTGVVT